VTIPSLEAARAIVMDAIHDYNGWVFKSNALSAPLTELNIDSLDAVKILMEIEEKLGVAIDSRRLDKVVTVGDLVRLVWEHMK